MKSSQIPAPAWLILLALGHVSSLMLIRAGPAVRYQHYPSWSVMLTEGPTWPLIVIGIQIAIVWWGVRDLPVRGLRSHVSRRWLPLGIAVLLTSAALSRSPTTWLAELLFASLIEILALATVVLLVTSLTGPALKRVGDLLNRALGPRSGTGPEPGGPDTFAWSIAIGVTVVASLLAWFAYERHPHVPDEVAYLIHAKYFAGGLLSLPTPAVPEAFRADLFTYEAARWFSPVPPGWPAALSIGILMGAGWLVNPILGGLNVVLGYVALREWYPRRTARIASLLLATSPWSLFMAMNFMTHTFTLTCALVGAVGVGRLRRSRGLKWAIIAGVAIGLVGLTRPLEGLITAGLLGLWSLSARGRSLRFAPTLVLALTTLLTSAAVLPYNRALSGSATTFPLIAYTDSVYGPGTNQLGFGASRGLGWSGFDPLPGHGILDVGINAALNLFQLNTELLGWATGSLLLLFGFFTFARLGRSDWAMTAAGATIIGIHSFYWFGGGPDFGARYWYLIIFPAIALSASALERLELHADRVMADGGTRVLLGGGILSLVALLVFVPWRASDKYHHYRGMRPDVRRLASAGTLADGLVLVRGCQHPDYSSAVGYNPLDLRTRQPVFVWDRGVETHRRLADAFADRPFFIVDGPTFTGNGYRVIAGPLTPEGFVEASTAITLQRGTYPERCPE